MRYAFPSKADSENTSNRIVSYLIAMAYNFLIGKSIQMLKSGFLKNQTLLSLRILALHETTIPYLSRFLDSVPV
jgi:hypothetical protein